MEENLYEYNPETYEELRYDVFNATEVAKYLFSLTPEAEDKKLLTPELLEELRNLRSVCDEFVRAFDYYSKKRS